MNAMDKRLKEHIDELIRLYDEARTTDKQERELADFFSQPHDTLPEEWERYAALFTAFAGSESLFSEAELEEMTTPLPRRSRRVWSWTWGVAAAIALLIGLFLHQPHTTEEPDYLAIAEQPSPNLEELGITSVDSVLTGRIAGLDIVPNSADMGDSVKIMQLGETTITPSDTEPSSTSPSSKEVMIGSHQVAKSRKPMTFNTPVLEVSNVFVPKDNALQESLQERIAKLDIVSNSSELGNNAMRLRGGRGTRLSNADPDSLLTLLCVSVNGELFLDSLNFLATLHMDEIRDYFLSQGKVFDDIDIQITKDDSTIISKYGWLPKKGKHVLMEITLKEEDYLAESEIISDFDKASQEGLMEFLRSGGSLQKGLMGFGNSDKASQEGLMEFCGLDESLQEEAITIGEYSLDDWTIAEQPIQNMKELDITSVDSALMGIKVGLNTFPDYKESSQKKRMKFTGAQKSRPTYHVSVDGELPPSSMNRLLTLTKNKIRKYSQSQGEEIEDFDVLITNGEKVW